MGIEHVCLNVRDLEKMKEFYATYFGFKANARYTNPKTGWSNYFLSSEDGGARLELLYHAEMKEQVKDRSASGFVHIAFRLGSQDKVIALSQKLKEAGFAVISEPRRTGDGYFESGVLDPEGNYLELTI